MIANRQLSLGFGKKVTVRIGEPRRSSDGRSYFCQYQIAGLGHDELRSAPGGLDSVHAIQLALEKIGIDLHVLNDAHGGAMRWDGDSNGNLGFPLRDEIATILKR
jgi:hypothetical protein